MEDSLLLLKLHPREDRASPELEYLLSWLVAQARQVFAKVRLLTVDEDTPLLATDFDGEEDHLLLIGRGGILIGRHSLASMQQQLAGQAVVVAHRLDRTDLPQRFPLFTLRGYEQAEQHLLSGGKVALGEEPTSQLPVSLWQRQSFTHWFAAGDLARVLIEPLAPLPENLARAGLFHHFVDYYGEAREDILPLIAQGSSVLEIGCARGGTARLLREQLSCRVTGVELNPEIAEEASAHLERLLIGDIQQLEPDQQFDVVLALELFEHLTEGEKFLRRAAGWLRPGGSIVLSVPNVGHYSIVEDLAAGRWDYLPMGLLCYTHFRFFTRATLEDWLRGCSFDDFDILAQKTDLPERCRSWPSGFEPDFESLSTSGFYVVIRAAD